MKNLNILVCFPASYPEQSKKQLLNSLNKRFEKKWNLRITDWLNVWIKEKFNNSIMISLIRLTSEKDKRSKDFMIRQNIKYLSEVVSAHFILIVRQHDDYIGAGTYQLMQVASNLSKPVLIANTYRNKIVGMCLPKHYISYLPTIKKTLMVTLGELQTDEEISSYVV